MPGWLGQAKLSSESELAKLMTGTQDKRAQEESESDEDEESRIPGESEDESKERRGWRKGVVAGMTEAERSMMMQLLRLVNLPQSSLVFNRRSCL